MERFRQAKVAGADLEGAFMNNPDDIVSVLINNLDGFISVHAGPSMVARRRSQGRVVSDSLPLLLPKPPEQGLSIHTQWFHGRS